MHKTIDINQRIPLDVLHVALESYLNDTYSNDYIIEQLRLEYSGENRIKKSLRIVNKIVPNNPIIAKLSEHPDEVLISLKKRPDRNIILIALLCSAFPFAFDTLRTFGKYFLVQKSINSHIIKRDLCSVYGGNRATTNGLYSIIPMFIEGNFFKRHKIGSYNSIETAPLKFPISLSIFEQSFSVNSNKPFKEMLYDPYFFFLNLSSFND